MTKATQTNNTDEWLTPDCVLRGLGCFDLDPCAHPAHRTRCAAQGYCLPEENGLLLPWSGRVWLNAPFGRELPKWINRMALHNNGVMIGAARVETEWFRVGWQTAQAVLFPYGRVYYLHSDLTPRKDVPFPSAIMAFGAANVEALHRLRSSLPGALLERWRA